MPVYMVERDLKDITMDQLAGTQKVAMATGREMTDQGKTVRHIRSTPVPGEGFHTRAWWEPSTSPLERRLLDAAVRVIGSAW